MSAEIEECCLLRTSQYTCRVSSVSENNPKQYGKQFMFDGCEDTCWNSKEGTPQWILIQFEKETKISSIKLQFQGGFAGKKIQICEGDSCTPVETFYPEDINSSQEFELTQQLTTKKLKFVFPESTDLFGRIIVYNLCLS